MDPLELIDIDQIRKEKIVDYGYKTVSKYFQRGILFAHKRENNVKRKTLRGSAQIRAGALQKIKQGARPISLEETGKLFEKIAGDGDAFIVSRLQNGQPIDKIEKAFMDKIKEKQP